MGRRWDDPEVKRSKGLVPYDVEKDAKSDGVVVQLAEGKAYTPPEISAMILQKLQDRRRGLPGREGDRGGHHRPGLLRRHASARRPRTPAGSPVSTSSASSTSRPPRRWPTASTRRATRRSPSTTSAAARSTSRSSSWATASSRSRRPTATPTSAATTSTSASSTGCWPSSRRTRASTWPRTSRPSSASRRPPRRPRSSCRRPPRPRSTCPTSRPTRPAPSTSS